MPHVHCGVEFKSSGFPRTPPPVATSQLLPAVMDSGGATVKRLDFDNISVSSSLHGLRMECQGFHRLLNECRTVLPEHKELMQTVNDAAEEFQGLDRFNLRETYFGLNSELLRLEAENHLLSSLACEGDSMSDDVNDQEFKILQNQSFDLSRKVEEEIQEVESLIDAFVKDMDNPAQSIESTLHILRFCEEKLDSWEGETVLESQPHSKDLSTWKTKNFQFGGKEQEEEFAVLKAESADVERGCSEPHLQAHELLKSTERMEIEILENEKEILLQEKYLERLQSLHDMQKNRVLSNTLRAFFSDWDVIRCENGEINLTWKIPKSDSKIIGHVAHSTSQKTKYRLYLRVDEETLAIKNVKFEPNDVPVDEIIEIFPLTRRIASLEPHEDLKLLLRHIGQRISLIDKAYA